jgi:hypothetical protein
VGLLVDIFLKSLPRRAITVHQTYKEQNVEGKRPIEVLTKKQLEPIHPHYFQEYFPKNNEGARSDDYSSFEHFLVNLAHGRHAVKNSLEYQDVSLPNL